MSSTARNTLLAAVGCLGLLGWGVSAGGRPAGPPAARAAAPQPVADYRVSGPFTHGNLAVFLLHGPDTLPPRPVVTLDEALARKSFVVHETGTVNTLCVENLSDADDVLIQPGDVVKGGRQDRLIAAAVIVPPKSGRVAVPSFCVEQSRWRQRGDEVATVFSENHTVVPGKELKNAALVQGNQGEVWANAAKFQDKLSANVGKPVAQSASPSSLYLSLEDRTVADRVRAYEDALGSTLRGAKGAIGFVVAVNGTVTGAEVFGSATLLNKAWPKVLRSAALEAVADAKPGVATAPVTAVGVLAFLADAEKGTGEQVASGATARTRWVATAGGYDLINSDIGLASELPAALENVNVDLVNVEVENVGGSRPAQFTDPMLGVIGTAPAAMALTQSPARIRQTYNSLTSRQQAELGRATEQEAAREVLQQAAAGVNPRELNRAGVPQQATPAQVQPAAVLVNRVQGQKASLVESRGANGGAVIHRSFIAK